MRQGRGFLEAESQETGVELAPKLSQIVPIFNNAKAPRTALFYGFGSAAGNDISFYAIAGVPSAGPDYQLTNLSPPRKCAPFFASLPLPSRHSSPLLSF